MGFPELDGDPLIDGIIDKCWHDGYATASTETLLPETPNGKESDAETTSTARWRMVIGRVLCGLWSSFRYWCASVPCLCRSGEATNPKVVNSREQNGHSRDMDQDHPAEEENFSSKRVYCQDLEKRGLLRMLSSGGARATWIRF